MRVLATVRLPSGMRYRLADLEEYDGLASGPFAVEEPATDSATGGEVWLTVGSAETYGLATAMWAAIVGVR